MIKSCSLYIFLNQSTCASRYPSPSFDGGATATKALRS